MARFVLISCVAYALLSSAQQRMTSLGVAHLQPLAVSSAYNAAVMAHASVPQGMLAVQ